MLVIGVGVASLVSHAVGRSSEPALNAFVLLAIPGVIVAGFELFAADPPPPGDHLARWLAGAAILVTGVCLVLFVLP